MKKQGEPRFSLVCRAVVYQLCLMMALQPAHPAFAEGIAVATGNTTLNQAGNGVPIVDIATPNGAGLSHNLYQDFNVGQAGVILNNATGQLTQTQLGGLIQNNPHLNGQAANLIINEVVGANPSQLQGYLEVAGQQAGVVVANPNGLTCDGCGFINTPNVTLTTGKPVLDAQGQLQALDVKQGTLTVGGKGLDATRQASVDLVARAVQLNGALHGQTVNVVAGANKVDRQTGDIVAQAGNGPAPEVAIDTAALGGMYAGKIRLVSTEQGVGVNLANVVAKQGDLTLDANGRVRLRDSAAQGQLTVNAQGNAELGGKLAAQGALIANATGDVTLSQSQLAADTVQLVGKQVTLSDSRVDARTVTLAAKETLNQQGEVSAAEQLTLSGKTVALAGRQQSGGGVTLTASDGASLQGTLAAAGPVTIKSGNHWVQGKTSTLESQGRVGVEANEVTLSGRMQGQQIALNTKALTSDASVTAGQTLAVNTQRATQQGVMHSQGQLDWRGEQLDNQGTLSADGTGELALAELSNGQTGQVLTKGPLTITSDTLTNQGKVVSEDALALTNKGALLNTGTLGGARLTLDTDRLDSRGMLLGRDGIALTGRELSSSGPLVSDGALTIGGQLLLLSGITKGQEVAIKANQLALDGSLQGDSVALEADQIASGKQGQLLSQTTLKVIAHEAMQEGTWAAKGEMGLDIATLLNRGTLASDAALRYQGNTLVNSGTVSTQSLDVQAQQLHSSGLLLAAQTGQITSHTLDNQGRLQAGGNLTLNTTELLNSNQLISGLALAITTSTFTNSGTTAAGTTLALQGATLTNHGKWVAADVLHVKADTITQGQTGITASNSALTIDATTLTGQGSYSANGPLTLKAATLNINGQLHSDDALTLDANQLTLAGTGYSKGDLTLRASDATLNGSLTSGQDATLQLSGALHHNGRLNANQIAVSAARVDGSGDLYAEKALNVSANQIAQGGTWLAKESASLTGDSLQLGGTLAALAGLTLNATSSLSSSDGAKVIAGTQLAVTAPTLQLTGRWQAGSDATVTTGQFTQPGDLVAGGKLQLNADNWQAQGVTQAAGTIDATLKGHGELGGRVTSHGDIRITANTLTNRGELLGQDNVALTVQGMLQQLGKLMGQQSLTIRADQLDQQGEVIAGNSQVTARTLNQQGKWLSGGQFSYQGQQLDNSGQLQATDINLQTNQTGNRGSVLAQNQLTLTGARLDNLGQWQAGAQTLTLNNLTNGQGAQLRSQTNGIINAQQLDNAGQLVAQGALQIGGITLSNQAGGLISADTLSLQSNTNLSSAGILFGLRQLLVTSATLDGSGQLLAGSKLGIDTGRVTQIGQWLSGGDLAMKVGSSLVSQGSISAKNQLELDVQGDWQNQGQWVAGSGLRATATGAFDNRGKLISNGAMQVAASSIDNSGSLQAGSTLRLDTSGALRNTGMLASQGDLGWQGESLFNGGTVYSGGSQTLTANSNLTNEYGTLLAERGATIKVNNGQLVNASGTIDGGYGVLDITALTINNYSDNFTVSEKIENEAISKYDSIMLADTIIGDPRSEKVYVCNNKTICTPSEILGSDKIRFVIKKIEQVASGSYLPALITSMGDAYINAPTIINSSSLILVGGNLLINSSSLSNKGASLGVSIEYAEYVKSGSKCIGICEFGSVMSDTYWPIYSFSNTAISNLDSGNVPSIISAGGNLTGTVAGMIDNVTIKAHAGPVSSTTPRPALTNVAVDGPRGPSWQAGSNAQQVTFTPVGEPNGVPLPDYPVPGGNGLFVVTDKPDSQYLIEVNPLISELGSAGNAALSNIDQALAAAAQASGQWDSWQIINTAQPGTLPNGAALTLAPSVEQNPTWTDLAKFLGSNYFFAQLNYNPERDIKLLGDAAFDTRVIRDAVLAQTGRRFINGEMGSDLAQMRWLIDNAAQNRRDLGLTPGVTLSAAQVAQLGRSMVWWEPVWFNGQIVLAPKLYLTEADKRHLSGSVITAANIDLTAGGINNSGTLLADGTLSLKSGTTLVNLGQIQAGGRLELLAKGNILNQSIIKGGEVAIASLDGSVRNETRTAQRHVDVNGILSDVLSDQTRFSSTDIGDIARIESAGNLMLQAGQDISLSASNLLAGLDMTLNAGRDITIGSLEDRRKWEEGNSRFSRVEQLMSSLDAGRALRLSADRDLTISASSLTAKGDASLTAGNELMLKTANNEASQYTTRRNGYDSARQREEVGVNLNADNIALGAGSDIAMRAANIQAEGELAVTAGRDLLLEAGDAMDYRESYTRESKKKAFSKKTTTTHDISEQHMAQATELGGQYVLLKAQQDLAVKGSNVVGDLGATLLAGRDLNIDTVDLLNRELHFRETKRSGLMGSGGIGFTIGKQQQSSDMVGTTLIREGSTVGSVQGDVTLQAGNRLQVSGSDIIAGKDLLLVGKDVTISSAEQQVTRKEEVKSKSGGLTVALTGGAVTAVQSAYDTIKASKESSNDRLVALQGTKAAMNGYQAWQGMQAMADAGGVPDPSFVGIAISVGNKRSQSNNQSSETNALTSELNAGGDVTVLARGDAANNAGDLVMIGSSIKGHNVTLGAARDLVLQSAVNSSDTRGSNSSSGWNAGISFGFTQGSAGISIFANMNAAKGKENGDSDRYTETSITASDTLTLKSGRDATLLGAQVSGDKVTADIGRNLTLTSQQDNDHYQSKQSSIAAGGSFTFGSMTGSGYINASRQKINSDFESVVEQTGIFAGKQGFAIQVGEHTQLNGAVLAGSADESKNRLSTGTLGWSDLVNRADYKVESQSVGISGSGGSKGGFSGQGAPTAASVLGGSNSSGSASSTTFAAISGGAIEIRNGAAQQQDVLTLLRDPAQAANGLSPIFDKQKELERMQEAQLIGEVGQQATQMVVSHHLDKANQKAKDDPEYANSKEYKALQEKWGIGSNFQRGMQAATAALQGLAGGNLTQAAAGAASPYLAQMVKQQTDDGPSRVMAHALVQGALAAAQNKNAMVGATGAATGELVGMMATQLYHKDASQLTEGEKETVSTLATLAAGLAGGLTGDSTAEVLAGAQTGKTVVENNLLSNEYGVSKLSKEGKALNEKLKTEGIGNIDDLQKKFVGCNNDGDCERDARNEYRQREREAGQKLYSMYQAGKLTKDEFALLVADYANAMLAGIQEGESNSKNFGWLGDIYMQSGQDWTPAGIILNENIAKIRSDELNSTWSSQGVSQDKIQELSLRDNIINSALTSADTNGIYNLLDNGASGEEILRFAAGAAFTKAITRNTIKQPYEPNKGAVGNMGEFFKQPGFGSQMKEHAHKTSQIFQGQSIYQAKKPVGDYIAKGDKYYLDGLHKDHIEVFDSKGRVKAVLNTDGSYNDSKTKSAIKEGRRLIK
ncbi:two-partner secretion domain-containing protein [Aeromonas veronii]|uniref:two-partner secretion domain-containing protein n=1 Tax=Aeromonas veronii TaxID=654 RepID=UPI004055755D